MAVIDTLSRSPRAKFKDWMFRQMHQKNLVYNTCWEDPRCDRALLDINSESKVVMITSAGCNALEYLLDQPAEIHCVDVNYRQNALLELKRTALRELSQGDLFRLFGHGCHPSAGRLFRQYLLPDLPGYARRYWERNGRMFSGRGTRRSFYFYGTSGTFAWMALQYFRTRRGLVSDLRALFASADMEEQRIRYEALEGRILQGALQRWLNRHVVMSMLGVPRAQQQLFMETFRDGALGYLRDSFRRVFLHLPVRENYFYHAYLFGGYAPDCCPAYLEEDKRERIVAGLDNLHSHTGTLSGFLRENPGVYSQFVLLDHQDWLADHAPDALHEEWELILANSRPGTRILLRSASPNPDFIPSFVSDAVHFETERTSQQHRLDRVGTYAGIRLAIVK